MYPGLGETYARAGTAYSPAIIASPTATRCNDLFRHQYQVAPHSDLLSWQVPCLSRLPVRAHRFSSRLTSIVISRQVRSEHFPHRRYGNVHPRLRQRKRKRVLRPRRLLHGHREIPFVRTVPAAHEARSRVVTLGKVSWMFVLAAQTPVLGYNTRLDDFMALSYIAVFFVVL
jgi:hypothetical protein